MANFKCRPRELNADKVIGEIKSLNPDVLIILYFRLTFNGMK